MNSDELNESLKKVLNFNNSLDYPEKKLGEYLSKIPTYLYHATEPQHVKNILRDGLKTSDGYIWLDTSIESARSFVYDDAPVFRVDIRKLDLDKLEVDSYNSYNYEVAEDIMYDTEDSGESLEKAMSTIGESITYHYSDDIPLEAIKLVRVGKNEVMQASAVPNRTTYLPSKHSAKKRARKNPINK